MLESDSFFEIPDGGLDTGMFTVKGMVRGTPRGEAGASPAGGERG